MRSGGFAFRVVIFTMASDLRVCHRLMVRPMTLKGPGPMGSSADELAGADGQLIEQRPVGRGSAGSVERRSNGAHPDGRGALW